MCEQRTITLVNIAEIHVKPLNLIPG